LTDESYIKLVIELAKKGIGKVSPNPLVGCVIIKDERIIGAGYHEKFGGNHAEVNAINSAKESVEDATLYINLEPCSHQGKTPPCVDKIIEKKFKRVVIGTLDMNPLVSGIGIKKLKAAGIEVRVGLLEKECVELNKFFFKYIIKKIPYVTLKAAQTIDGKIADNSGNSKWISSFASRRRVHSLRAKYDAVLIGVGTVQADDPNLTVRLTEGRNPKRIILDSNLQLSTNHKIFSGNNDKNLIVVASRKSISRIRRIKKLNSLGVVVLFTRENRDGKINLKSALHELAKHQIASVLVEGGSEIYTSFLRDNLFDNIILFISPKILGPGLSFVNDFGKANLKNVLKLKFVKVENIDDDLLVELTR
jgi:diaminohydroxyphosphoribosylaminopyrimidine deaminase / 5-amino-6-(5-phosphoribosylamino)uracil reductase